MGSSVARALKAKAPFPAIAVYMQLRRSRSNEEMLETEARTAHHVYCAPFVTACGLAAHSCAYIGRQATLYSRQV